VQGVDGRARVNDGTYGADDSMHGGSMAEPGLMTVHARLMAEPGLMMAHVGSTTAHAGG
jgi:hypothetical protein